MSIGEGGRKEPGEYASNILDTAMRVITRPVDFYRQMPTSGGFADPVIFIVVMGIAGGVVQAFLSILGIGPGGTFGLAAIVITPVAAALFGFVGAAILFGIWKLMGSARDYETAYRCAAYSAAVSPITTLVHPVPYLGALFSLAWGTYLMIVASIEVQRIDPRRAQLVFGILAAFFALLSISTEYKARDFGAGVANVQEMSPEEAGRKAVEFMKGFQKGMKE